MSFFFSVVNTSLLNWFIQVFKLMVTEAVANNYSGFSLNSYFFIHKCSWKLRRTQLKSCEHRACKRNKPGGSCDFQWEFIQWAGEMSSNNIRIHSRSLLLIRWNCSLSQVEALSSSGLRSLLKSRAVLVSPGAAFSCTRDSEPRDTPESCLWEKKYKNLIKCRL